MWIIAKAHKIKVNKNKCRAYIGEGQICGQKVVLAKPQTYMNNSGDSVKELLAEYNVSAEDSLIVISDDISLDVGKLRIRRSGSAGGHNGLKNIIKRTGTSDFARIRIAVGRVPEGGDIIKHVLTKFSRADRKCVTAAMKMAVEAVDFIAKESLVDYEKAIECAMSKFNGSAV